METAMKPSDIATSLHLLTRIQKPAFLWGPPGVGKSQIVAQVAALLACV
jgi:MoxR-like ATPase